jgi:hypothetical protein
LIRRKITVTYLFEFNFSSGTINGFIHKWCNQHKIDTFNDLGNVYADIYGDGDYRKLFVKAIWNDLMEVYATDKIKHIEDTGLSRRYLKSHKAFTVLNPCRKVKIVLEDGFTFTDDFSLPSEELPSYFQTAGTYSHDGKAWKIREYYVIG